LKIELEGRIQLLEKEVRDREMMIDRERKEKDENRNRY
jgi:hypothetical protein